MDAEILAELRELGKDQLVDKCRILAPTFITSPIETGPAAGNSDGRGGIAGGIVTGGTESPYTEYTEIDGSPFPCLLQYVIARQGERDFDINVLEQNPAYVRLPWDLHIEDSYIFYITTESEPHHEVKFEVLNVTFQSQRFFQKVRVKEQK